MDFDPFDPEFFPQEEEQAQPNLQSSLQPQEDPEVQESQQPRRRRRTEGEPRRRGRPRVHPRDETATERRRTQIRLAQRAYRQRKETTITGLRRRVDGLGQIVQGMNDSFQNLYNQFAASGIQSYQPQLANLFETTANEFTQFLQNAIPPEEDQQGDEEEEDAEVQENAPQDLQSGEEQQPGLTVPSQGDEQFIWDTDPFPQLFHCSFPPLNCPLSPKAPYLTRSPSLPETYSYTETSFTRRLIRLTIEAGVKSLTNNPSVESTPRWLSFVYSFGGTHETVLSCLQALLSRSANQNFEDWTNTPILHLGGAGLHFPRKGIDASSPAPNWWSEYAPMGPLPVHIQPVDPKYLGWKIEDIVNDIGLGGDWFDANDVEWYLQSRGLNLDVTSTVVEINEDIPLQPEMMSRLSLAEETRGRENHERGGQEAGQGYARNQYFSPISMSPSQQPEANFEDSTSWSSSVFPPQPQVAALNGQLWNQNLSINVTTDTNTNMNMNMNMNQSSSAMTTTPGINRNGRRKTRKFFDVERFLKVMISRTVCLGRTPGYRPWDVERAFRIATVINP